MTPEELETKLKKLHEDFSIEIATGNLSDDDELPAWDIEITVEHPESHRSVSYVHDTIDCEHENDAINTVIENYGDDMLAEARAWAEDNIKPESLRLTVEVDAGSFADYNHNDGGDFTIWPEAEAETIHVAIRGDEEGYLADPDKVPLGWLNSAQIYAEPGMDQVTFTISVGDPRGAHAFRIYRDNGGIIHITFPTPDQGMLHTPLKEVRPGHYIVGH